MNPSSYRDADPETECRDGDSASAGSTTGQTCSAAPCPSEAESCKEINVTVPRQRVHVPCRAANAAPQLAEQQLAQTRQVILVPQQVYVPFVQTTNFGAVRVSGLQQTQFVNAQGVLTTATAGAAAGQEFRAGTQSADGSGGGQVISQEEARKCQDELKQYKALMTEMSARVQALQAEVQKLKPQ